MFDSHLDFLFKDQDVTLDTYPIVFEQKYGEVLKQISPILKSVNVTDDDLNDLKNDCFNKFQNKCSFQSSEIISLVDPNHKEWLQEKSSSIKWNQWDAYSNYLKTEKKFNSQYVDAIGELSNKIIDRIEDPEKNAEIKVKGLLMGEVQSGKTGSFMAVLHKATDVGWRFIIVLSGLTDDLRFQTQQRINSDFIGYTLSEREDHQNCGIREVSEHYDFINFEPLTTLHKDFSQNQLSKILKNQEKSVYVAVCKKQSIILNNLLKWLGGDPDSPQKNADRREIANKIPCLIVDDEADLASPNTKKDYDEYSAVNGAIRNLLNFFNKSAYLAITATPYANIFINPQLHESQEQPNLPDLFPKNFIFVKPSPEGYVGVHQLFGVDEDQSDDLKNKLEEKVVITIDHNDEEIFKHPLKKDSVIDKLPPSLITALRYYFCCCVYKEMTIDSHVSMLAHIDYRKTNHKTISELIKVFYKKELNELKLCRGLPLEELQSNDRYLSYKKIWEQGCVSKSASINHETFESLSKTNFLSVWRRKFVKTMEKVKIETINSDYKGEKLADIYDKFPNSKLILVGGYALSRGITIEGLCVTYLTRKSATVDTLLQMGRFFGYRGYDIKIMKIWLGQNIKEMFEESAMAQQEFVTQVKIMNDHDQTPSTFGFKFHQAPANLKLRIAAKNKMYHSKSIVLDVNIAGHPLQSSKLPLEIELLKKNKEIVSSFIKKLGSHETLKHSNLNKNRDIVWKNVNSDLISDLVSNFNAYGWGDINRANIAEFINEKLKNEKWIVTVLSNNNEKNDSLNLFNLNQSVYAIPSKVYIKDLGKKFIYFEKGSLMRSYDLVRRLTDDEKNELQKCCGSKELDNNDVVRNKPNLQLSPQLIIYSVQPNFFMDAVDEKEYKNLICGLAIGIPCGNDLKKTELKLKYDVNDIFMFNLDRESSL